MDRDPKTGRFLKGHKGGRPKGSKNRADLTKAFINDVTLVWQERGLEGLWLAAKENPLQFAKLVAQVIPRDDSLLVQHEGQVTTKTVNVSFLEADQGVAIEGEVEIEGELEVKH